SDINVMSSSNPLSFHISASETLCQSQKSLCRVPQVAFWQAKLTEMLSCSLNSVWHHVWPLATLTPSLSTSFKPLSFPLFGGELFEHKFAVRISVCFAMLKSTPTTPS